MRLVLTLTAVLLLASGCVSVNKSVLSETRMTQPLPKEQVTVYFSDDELPEHERIAILNAQGSDSMTNEGQMIDKLREEAGKLGANAIVLEQLRGPGGGERAVAAFFGGDAQRRGQALAIYVLSAEAR